MDDKWRITCCPSCGGGGVACYDLCIDCDGGGQLWIRPGGHCFKYPGGPAEGMWSKEEYNRSTPVMPYEWHTWNNTEEEIENFPLDRNGNFDGTFPVECVCGWYGTIKDHYEHVEKMKQQFIVEHQGAV